MTKGLVSRKKLKIGNLLESDPPPAAPMTAVPLADTLVMNCDRIIGMKKLISVILVL